MAPRKPSTSSRPGESRRTVLSTPAPKQSNRARIIMVYSLVVLLVVVCFAVMLEPLHKWTVQRQESQRLTQQINSLKADNARLEAQLKRIDDPRYIEQEARARLGYVKVGQTVYLVLEPDRKAEENAQAANSPGAQVPWFVNLSRSADAWAQTQAQAQGEAAAKKSAQTTKE